MRRLSFRLSSAKLLCVVVASILVGAGLLSFVNAAGNQLQNRSVAVTDTTPGVIAAYKLAFTPQNDASEIIVDFCSDSPLPGDSCSAIGGTTVPDTSGVTTTDVSSVSDGSTEHTLRIVNQTLTAGTPFSLEINNITNPTNGTIFFVRIYTYATGDSAAYVPLNSTTTSPTEGSYIDHGGLALSAGKLISITAIVPPYIRLCAGVTITGYDCSTATGDYLQLGNLSSSQTSSASIQLVLATNAQSGYSLRVTGNTLTSGNDVIPPLANNDIARPGVSQFGLNLRANTTPPVGANKTGPGIGTISANYNQPDFFRFVSGDLVASAPAPSDNNKYTASYIANISKSQPVGVYATTITYVALANF
ncbi:MAG TPA: hypothetical protein VHD60_00370 [Candidatus Saccharimonadales bacterium]|nr:hypothetical protein [Candidatus Saccharimonadales bacterium]